MTSMMRQEIDAIPASCAALVAQRERTIAPVAAAIRAFAPRFAMVCGRGSSGHAGTFARYLLGLRAGLVTAESSPSIVSLYRRELSMDGALFVLFSQSGRSPDLVASAEAARAAGAFTVAIVNDPDSPAARACAAVIPILAGPERSVAATKTVVNSLIAGAALVAELAEDRLLSAAIDRLPARLAAAAALDWSAWGERLVTAQTGYVLARGPALAIAQEIALKLAESAGLPCLAYSIAEFRHGPRAAMTAAMPALLLRHEDASADDADALLADLRDAGMDVASAGGPRGSLPWTGDDDPALDPIVALAAAYRAIEALARARGRDPDAPPHLKKVTRTL
jgi:glutamine---fructose-6-phosphate transaminase (isomerizing)